MISTMKFDLVDNKVTLVEFSSASQTNKVLETVKESIKKEATISIEGIEDIILNLSDLTADEVSDIWQSSGLEE